MENIDLILLREIFRTRMNERDFCIGKEQVEKLFRELLGESEPVREYTNTSSKSITSKEVSDIIEDVFGKGISKVFESDNAFFDKIRRN